VEAENLSPERALQSSVGVEHAIGGALSLEATVYHAWLQDLVSGREDRFEFMLGPPPLPPLDVDEYANDGTGHSVGLETMIRWSDSRTIAWISSTLSRATRVKRPGDDPVLFEYDQPVNVMGVVSHKLPGRWLVGARLRYGSGNPYTPVGNRIIDVELQEFIPVYTEDSSQRLPAFWSLDFRVDRDWVFRNWILTTYLDLQNTTNRKNVELMNWSTDWSTEVPVYGLPIVPAFGLRGAW